MKQQEIIQTVVDLVKKHFGDRVIGVNPASYSGTSNRIYIKGTERKSRDIMNLSCVKNFLSELQNLFNVAQDSGADWRSKSKNHVASNTYRIELDSKNDVAIYFDVNYNDWIQVCVEGTSKYIKMFNNIICNMSSAEEYSVDKIFGKGHYKQQQEIKNSIFGPYMESYKQMCKKYGIV